MSYNYRVREEVVVDKFGTKTVKTVVESFKTEGYNVETVSQRILPANAYVTDVRTDREDRITRVTYYKDGKEHTTE